MYVTQSQPDVAEIEVVVGTGEVTQLTHELLVCGLEVIIQPHHPVLAIQLCHLLYVLLNTMEVLFSFVTRRIGVSIERESKDFLVTPSLVSISATCCAVELNLWSQYC